MLVFQLLVPATLLATQHGGFSHREKQSTTGSSAVSLAVSHGICSVKKFIDPGITCLPVTIPYKLGIHFVQMTSLRECLAWFLGLCRCLVCDCLNLDCSQKLGGWVGGTGLMSFHKPLYSGNQIKPYSQSLGHTLVCSDIDNIPSPYLWQ